HSGNAGHESIAVKADITASAKKDSKFDITARSGDADYTYGIFGDITAKGADSERISYITVYSGDGIETIGITKETKDGEQSNIELKNVILQAYSGTGKPGSADVRSYGILGNNLSAVNSIVYAQSGEEESSILNGTSNGICLNGDLIAKSSDVKGYGTGTALINIGILADRINADKESSITGFAEYGKESSVGIAVLRSLYADDNSCIDGYSGNSAEYTVGIYCFSPDENPITVKDNSRIIGRAGDIDLTGVTLDEEETLEAISAGIYITGLPLTENTVLELKNSDAIGSSGSINYGEYGNSSFVAFKTYGIYADVIKANNSTVSGKTEAYLLSERGENAVADAYGIYAKQIDAKKGSEIFGGRQSSEPEAIQEPIESSKQFSNSNGIYVGELNVSKSTVNGFGEQADFSAGIELGKTLNAKKSVIRGTGAENSYNSYGVFTSDAHLVLDKESSFYGKGGDQSLISGGILLGNTSLVEVKNSSIVGVGGDNVNVSYGISGYNTSLHVEDSEMTAHAGIASMNSYGVSLRADSKLIIEGKSNVFADTGDRESMEPSGKESYAIYMERLGEDEAGMIMVSGDSSLVAVSSGAEEESVAIYIDGSIFLYDTSLLISICNTEAGTGIGLENGNLYAMDHSEIVIAGSKQAFGDHVGQYLFDNRGVRISENCKGKPYTYWNKYDDLRTESVKYAEIDDDEQQNYVMTSGEVIWKKDSTDGAVFVFKNSDETTVNITYPHFTGVQVDGERLDPSKYTAIPGSVIVTLKPAYLNTLEEGIHFLTVMFNNGNNVSSQFRIAKADPKPTPEPGKKGSGGTRTSNTSSVVTCQMAGYPNGYAWNEAAKACQPGYIDANGVFHSYK
ncbi:MAG: hypothetical protein IKF60_09775, partial [Solobacterium sp.]|nr:hypothetical protein [Solobacterium sp.]